MTGGATSSGRGPTSESSWTHRTADVEVDDESHSEHDEAALKRHPSASRSKAAVVIYDIAHSPSYRVPVLYLSSWQPPSIKLLDLIGRANKPEAMQPGGPEAALSMTDHPVTGRPAYFVHPCRTAEAIWSLSKSRELRPEEYLMLWFGLVGSTVGLAVPFALAEALSSQQ